MQTVLLLIFGTAAIISEFAFRIHNYRLEAGISYPSVFTILKLAKGLQLPPEALIAAAEPHEKAGA